MFFGKCCSGRIEMDLLEDILDSNMIAFKRLKSLNCENLPVMFEGTNLDKPKPSVQNTGAANLQGDSKLARFTIWRTWICVSKKQRYQYVFHFFKRGAQWFCWHIQIRQVHKVQTSEFENPYDARFGVAQKCLGGRANANGSIHEPRWWEFLWLAVPKLVRDIPNFMLEIHRNPNDYWHKLSISTENRLSYSENVSRR